MNSLSVRLGGVVALFFAVFATAEGGSLKRKRSLDTTGGPYCGIYSLYAALRIVHSIPAIPAILLFLLARREGVTRRNPLCE
jgi:hypothetical protein